MAALDGCNELAPFLLEEFNNGALVENPKGRLLSL